MRKFSYKATTKNGFGKYCVNNNACIMTDFYHPNMKGGHRHNHIRNAHNRMRKCHVCGEPIVKGCEYTDGFSEFQCRSCRTEECREQACLVGISFGGCEFETRRRRK